MMVNRNRNGPKAAVAGIDGISGVVTVKRFYISLKTLHRAGTSGAAALPGPAARPASGRRSGKVGGLPCAAFQINCTGNATAVPVGIDNIPTFGDAAVLKTACLHGMIPFPMQSHSIEPFAK